MMCQSMGEPPISTIGLGLTTVSSLRRVPRPPARITVFIQIRLLPVSVNRHVAFPGLKFFAFFRLYQRALLLQ